MKTFTIDIYNQEAIETWLKEIEPRVVKYKEENGNYQGAIGVGLTVEFTNTSIGTFITVKEPYLGEEMTFYEGQRYPKAKPEKNSQKLPTSPPLTEETDEISTLLKRFDLELPWYAAKGEDDWSRDNQIFCVNLKEDDKVETLCCQWDGYTATISVTEYLTTEDDEGVFKITEYIFDKYESPDTYQKAVHFNTALRYKLRTWEL